MKLIYRLFLGTSLSFSPFAYASSLVVNADVAMNCNEFGNPSSPAFSELDELLRKLATQKCGRQGMGLMRFERDEKSLFCSSYRLSGSAFFSCVY
jgi:hypothetical protein